MSRITLGFKAFDPHELLVHFVAVRAGLYRRESLEVELADITFVADNELPDDWYQASCGAALTSAVRGLAQKVVFVAVDRPMFWIWSRTPLGHLSGLRGRSLATFPSQAPPHNLANIVLRKAGIDPANEVRLLQARDDVARLGLVRSGSADAAVLSSAIAPARLTALGFESLCWIGDELRLPTTGLAVDAAHIARAPAEVRALVGIHREALRRVHADPDLAATVLREDFDVSAEHAAGTAQLYRTAFTADGRTSPEIAQRAIDALCAALAIAQRPAWDQVYVFG